MTITLPVNHPTGRYPVFVGANLLPQVVELAQIKGDIALITDSAVAPRYNTLIDPPAGKKMITVTVPAGEVYKTLDIVQTIYHQLLNAKLDRQATVVALGGGVINDMAGFVAATYLRGVDFVTCPTTLLAMVDASVGGKTGVDMPQGKNLIGAFKQPTAVLADVSTLKSLPPAEFAAGMAEVIKHGLINRPGLLEIVSGRDWLADMQKASWSDQFVTELQTLVAEAISVKQQVVQNDPFEQGERALLNLGHTFGHAIEQVSQYQVRHGEGVAIGLVCSAHLSHRLGYAPAGLQAQIEQWLKQVQLPTRIPADLPTKALLSAMGSDKKRAQGQLHFVLIRQVGDTFLQGGIPEHEVVQTLEALKQ